MDKVMFNELLASVQKMNAIVDGKAKPSGTYALPEPEVKAIREQTGLSQNRFAHLIGVSKRTLENWEQGRRHPTGSAKALLRIVAVNPQDALTALHG